MIWTSVEQCYTETGIGANIKQYSIDVPMLMKHLQNMENEIESLNSRISTLEGQVNEKD